MAQEKKSVLAHIPLTSIRENPVALRNVNRQSEEYIGLVDSIKSQGVLNPINVREITNPDGDERLYGLIDGLHRFSAAKDAGLSTIPAQVVSKTDAEVLIAQVLANVHKVETRPTEYSKQLMRILSNNPAMTMTELANTLSKSPSWLSERLSLLKIEHDTIKELINEGKINLSNAYALAKLPPEEQANFLDRAQTDPPQVFIPAVNTRVKEIRDAKRKGQDAAPAEFVAVPHLQKIGILKDEMTQATVGKVLIQKYSIKTPLDAWTLALRWVLHMDQESVSAAKSRDDARKAKLEEEKKKKAEERQAKRAQEAAKKAAEVSVS